MGTLLIRFLCLTAVADGLPRPHLDALRVEAEQGNSQSQYLLSVLLLLEKRTNDQNEAIRWLRAAAEKGDPRAQNLLGLMVDPVWNNPLDADASKAANLYAKSANQGYPPALHNLETLVERGHIDPSKAAQLQKRTPQDATSRSRPQSNAVKNAELTAQEVFRRIGPAVAEIKSEGNYGSGVIIGQLQAAAGTTILQAHGKEHAVSLPLMPQQTPLAPTDETQSFLLIATNEHVIGNAHRVHVGLGIEGDSASATFASSAQVCVSIVPQEDLAFVLVGLSSLPSQIQNQIVAAPLYSKGGPPEKGSVVFALGNPEGLTRTITQGLYNGVRPEGLQFDAPISVGSSGGALITTDGELIGLTSGFSANEATQNLNFALPIFRLIQNLNLGQSTCRS